MFFIDTNAVGRPTLFWINAWLGTPSKVSTNGADADDDDVGCIFGGVFEEPLVLASHLARRDRTL